MSEQAFQALQEIDAVLSKLAMGRAEHVQMQQRIEVIQQAITKPVETSEEPPPTEPEPPPE